MKRLHARGGRFDNEDVNPMNYISNLSDADGSVLVDKDNAAAMTQEELDKMQHDTSVGQDSQGMEKAGELYYDAATGTYYIVRGN